MADLKVEDDDEAYEVAVRLRYLGGQVAQPKIGQALRKPDCQVGVPGVEEMSRFHREIGPCGRCRTGTGDHETATGCIMSLVERLETSRNNFLDVEAQLSRATAEIAALKSVVEASGYLRNIAGSALPYSKIMDGLAAFDAAMAKLKETQKA